MLARSISGAASLLLTALAAVAQPRCPHMPEPVPQLRSQNIYGGADLRAAPDAASSAERERLTADLNEFLRLLGEQVRQHRRGKALSGDCSLQALQRWASAGALLGPLDNEAARKDLIWNSVGLQLAYLQLRGAAPAAQRRQIEPWLRELALRVRQQRQGSASANNVLAWAALSQAAAAALSGDEADWQLAERWQARVLAEVDAQGLLRPELARGRRALAYHQFAAAPLLAQFALARAAGRSDQAPAPLRRLVDALDRLERDPEVLARQTGSKQDDPGQRMRRNWRWLASCIGGLAAQDTAPPFERWLGGGVEGLCSLPTSPAGYTPPP